MKLGRLKLGCRESWGTGLGTDRWESCEGQGMRGDECEGCGRLKQGWYILKYVH